MSDVKYETPTTIAEWRDYIENSIPDSELINTAREMGGNTFIRILKEEGYDAKAIHAIHMSMALRLLSSGLRIPQKMDNCHIDYNAMVMHLDSEELPQGEE